MVKILQVVALLAVAMGADAARILGLMPTASPSHHIWNQALVRALLKKGHHVTVVSPDFEPSSLPSYRHIHLEGVYEKLLQTFEYEDLVHLTAFHSTKVLFDWGEALCEACFQTKGLQQLIKLTQNETFDLVLTEMGVGDCFFAFIPKFGSPPVVAVSAFGTGPWVNEAVGSPLNPSYINSFTLPYSDHMTFTERLLNTLLQDIIYVYRRFVYLPRVDEIVQKTLGPSPSVIDVDKNFSMALINFDQRLDYPRPVVPAMIPVGGMHIKPAKPLPKDLQKFLDEAKEGVVVFSLGSNLRSDKLTPQKREALLGAFREIPQKVLWKWESESLPGQPPNVKIHKWLPLNDVLAHPNVRVFITHSGLLSSQEAQYHGVPVIGIPFFADQYINIQRSVLKGTGLKLSFVDLTKESMLQTLNEVLKNDSYQKNAKEWSRIFRDQPMGPLDTAVYWVEYVLRNNGARHLRSAAVDLPWYQYYLLDIAFFLLAVDVVLVVTLYLVVKKLCSCVFGNQTKKQKKH